MSYTPEPIRAPRLQGTALSLSAVALEHRFPGAAVAATTFSAIGLKQFRELTPTELPLFLPLVPAPVPGTPGTSGPPAADAPDLEHASALIGSPEGEPTFPSVMDYARAYRQGDITPVAVANELIDVLERHNRSGATPLYSFIAWNRDEILKDAEESAKRIRENTPRSIFEGVPVAVKDEIDVAGYSTSVGTSFKHDTPCAQDAWVVQRLRDAGALILGKTNMHEIGIGVTGINPFHGTPLNPYAPDRCPGGSSSGSASAIATGICPVALGADGGGSVRIPAAYCGIFGLKTTWGRTSATGEYALGYTVGNIGPMAATARDLALAYLVTAAVDPEDHGAHAAPPPNLDRFQDNLEGVRIGVYQPWFDHAHQEVLQPTRRLLELLREGGATVVEIEIDGLEELRLAHLVTISLEMRAAMAAELRQRRRDFGDETRTNLALARYLTTTDYLQAQKIRRRLSEEVRRVHREVDLIATPTTANLAPALPGSRVSRGVSDIVSMNETMRFLVLANMLGNPAVSVPAGFAPDNAPVGLQLIGRHWEEALLLRAARVCEELVPRPLPQVFYAPLGAQR